MPITQSAKKKLRQDKKRKLSNERVSASYKKAVKTSRNRPTPGNLQVAYRMLDKAAKYGVIHKNKAARLKSRLSKLKSQGSKVKTDA